MLKLRGFTLIELLVVMAIIATLLSIVLPRYLGGVERSKETTLRQDLNIMRDALDKYYGDTGNYPTGLDELVAKHYLKAIPQDPITESSGTWTAIPPSDLSKGGVFDVKSGATGKARNGKLYSEW